MAVASINHNRIVRNLATALTNAFAGKACEAFASDLRLRIGKKDFFTYPDLVVVCGEPEFFEERTDTITNPTVIIEVLSESTERDDRSDKFHAYWTLETLEEYVLVDQYRMQVEYFLRLNEKEWRLLVLTKPDEPLKFESFEVEIPLEQIYQDVTWEI